MMKTFSKLCLSAFLFAHLAAARADGGIDARMMRYPDVSATQIAFVYAGDIWVAPKTGGQAMRLSSPKGEETFPRFSPDGSKIAFSGDYDGNVDIYLIPAAGGLPKRLTYHGAPDRMLEWYPDGKSILFASTRSAEKDRFNQLFKISADGGLPEKLPVPYGEFGSISADGKTLAYTPISTDFRTWKRYRGGMNPAIWLFDLQTFAFKDLTGNDAANSIPMWHGSTLYFLSDRDENKRANIWACDTKTGAFREITKFADLDVHFPSMGPEDIVFENGGRLYLLNLATEKYDEVKIQVLTDRTTLKPHLEDVSKSAHEADFSPNGKRVVFEARGDIFTVPAEHGVVRNLTASSGVAERFPAWSPDGKTIAYFTDRSGEYELAIRPADGTGKEEILTKLGPGFRFHISWSPDSKKLAFIDQTMRVRLHDLDKKETSVIAQELWMYEGNLHGFSPTWSRDSRWMAFPQDSENRRTTIVLYDTTTRKTNIVTSAYYDDDQPTWDADGKYLYYVSGRELAPDYSDLDSTWIYANTAQIMAVSLRKDVPSLLAPRNDDEGDKDTSKDKKKDGDKDKDKDKKKDEKKKDAADAKERSTDDKKSGDDDADKKKAPEPVEIDLADFERRAIALPIKSGPVELVGSTSGQLIYLRRPRTGSAEEKSKLQYYDLEKREEKTILDDADFAILAAGGKKILVRRKTEYAIIEPKEDQKFDKKVPVSGLEAMIDPVAEWQQIFTDTWRFFRDFFYDPNMHGEDWNAMRARYGGLLKDAVTRWDVNYIQGELIGELNSSHTYRSGGDVETGLQRGVGYLGVDFSLENGAYRIAKIIDGAPWDAEVRSPLRMPGINVSEGDYILAVNGTPLDASVEPYAAFQGLAGKDVYLTVNNKPDMEGSREILVETLSSEARLRNLAWIEHNRQRVEKLSGGKIGYAYVPDTGQGGETELVRQFRAQYNKPGFIVDERFNSGGQIPDRFIEMLGRKTLNYWGVRDGHDWRWPTIGNAGPKAMLINGWSGSGGDCLPFYFRQAGLGPLIGQRTWGGLIGITGAPELVDGGTVSVPTFGIYGTNGEWIIEGHGIDPDIAVVDDPSLMAKGGDPQLERAVQEVMKSLEANPMVAPKKPAYPNRSGK